MKNSFTGRRTALLEIMFSVCFEKLGWGGQMTLGRGREKIFDKFKAHI